MEGDRKLLTHAILTPLLDTCDDYMVEMCRYFAADPEPWLHRTHRRRVAILQTWNPLDTYAASAEAYRAGRGVAY